MPLSPEQLANVNAQVKQDNTNELQAQANSAQQQTSFNPIDWGSSFVRAAAEDTVNLFGVDKSPQTIQFEKDNPLAGFAANFVGVGVPYAGWYKASKGIKAFEKFLDTTAIANAPIRSAAIREAVRFAPFEGARLVTTGVNNPSRFDDTAWDSATNLALAGGIGGLGGIGEAYGQVAKQVKELAPNVNLRDPMTMQLRTLRDLGESGQVDPSRADDLTRWINRYDAAVRAEVLPQGQKYINSIENFEGGDKKASWFNSLFKPQSSKNFGVRILTDGSSLVPNSTEYGYVDPAAWQSRLAALPDNATSYMQFPRVLEVRGDGGAKYLGQRLADNMLQVAPDTYMAREADNGMYLMMKKIKYGGTRQIEPGVSNGDEFMLFKTDRPDIFNPRGQAWMDRMVSKAAWWSKQSPENTYFPMGTTGSFLQGQMKRLPLRNWYDDLSKAKTEGDFLTRMAGHLGIDPSGKMTDASRGLYAYLKEYFAPTIAQFNGPGGTLARWIYGNLRPTYDRANYIAENMIYGTPQSNSSKSLLMNLFFHDEHKDFVGGGPAIQELVKKLDNADRLKLEQVMAGGWTKPVIDDRYNAGEISDRLHSLLSRLSDLDERQMSELQGAQKTVGLTPSKPLTGHLMLSRMWDGDWRLRIRDQDGQTVYMVGAPQRGTAISQANKIIDEAGMQGKWTFDNSAQETKDLFRKGGGQENDLSLLEQLNTSSGAFRKASAALERLVRSPATLKQRLDVAGYATDMSDNAILKRLHGHTRAIQNHIADLLTTHMLQSEMSMLNDQAPGLYNQVMDRWNNLRGRAGKFSDQVDAHADKLLSPVLGSNSATKVVRVLNTAQHNLMLGMGNIAYPIVNALQFVQTVLPQIAFVQSANAAKLGEYYNSVLMHGPDKLVRGPVSTLDPIKLAYQGFRTMYKPTVTERQLFDRAVEEGVFAPRLVEEHIGANAQFKQRLSGLLNEKGGFVKFLQYLSEWLPNKSEQFSRLHSFATGVKVGDDLLGLSGDNLYRFAKEFTHNTMFGYNMVDRAKVITGPIGSFLGLYKNWQMHYLTWFLNYANEAAHGNFAPLLWSNLGTASIAGAGGTALYGLADAFSRAVGAGSAMPHVYKMFSGNANGQPDMGSDAVFFGLPAFFNTSLQSSASSAGAKPMKDAANLFSLVQLERGMALGKAIGKAWDVADSTGQSPFADPLVRSQLLAALAPRSFARSAQVLEGNYLSSLNTGNPVVKGLSPMERFSYAMGFNTPETDRMYQISDELWQSEQKRQIAVSAFARRFVELQDAKDYPELTRLTRQIVASGVGIDSVIRSAQSIRERGIQDLVHYRAGKHADRGLIQQFEVPEDQ